MVYENERKKEREKNFSPLSPQTRLKKFSFSFFFQPQYAGIWFSF